MQPEQGLLCPVLPHHQQGCKPQRVCPCSKITLFRRCSSRKWSRKRQKACYNSCRKRKQEDCPRRLGSWRRNIPFALGRIQERRRRLERIPLRQDWASWTPVRRNNIRHRPFNSRSYHQCKPGHRCPYRSRWWWRHTRWRTCCNRINGQEGKDCRCFNRLPCWPWRTAQERRYGCWIWRTLLWPAHRFHARL